MTEIPFTTLERGVAAALPAGVSDASVYVPDNDGLALVQVHNPTGVDVTVTLVSTATVAGVAAANTDVTVPAGATVWLGPLAPALFNDDSGSAYLDDASAGQLVFTGLRF